MKQIYFCVILIASLLFSSCNGGNTSSSVATGVISSPTEESPSLQMEDSSLNTINIYTKGESDEGNSYKKRGPDDGYSHTKRESEVRYIGYWKVPLTSKQSTNIRLFYNPKAVIFFTKEYDTLAMRQDSVVVIVTKKNQEYRIEYVKYLIDNYIISDERTIIWRCAGYSDVACSGSIDIGELASAYKQYSSRRSTKAQNSTPKSFSEKDRKKIYEWSKSYVRMNVVESSSLSFPSLSDVKICPEQNVYKIEYKAFGKNLYNERVVYSVRIIFSINQKREPVFCSIFI